MRKIKLITTDRTPLYEGVHTSMSEAIEHAITHHINLDGIDCEGAILCNINLDSITLRNANFKNADLTGANMSEANFINCNFSGADLTQACCCYSDFTDCHFNNGTFAATDISMASLEKCAFEGVGIFNLNFHSAFKTTMLTYQYLSETYHFCTPPIIIRSPQKNIIIVGNNVISNKIQAIDSTSALVEQQQILTSPPHNL